MIKGRLQDVLVCFEGRVAAWEVSEWAKLVESTQRHMDRYGSVVR